MGYTALSGKDKKAKDLLVEWSGISDLTDEETNQIDMAIGYAKV